MKLGVKLFTIAIALASLTPLWAATFTYEAVNDFTDIDAGEVPYYRHNGVNALAINAGVEEFREKFARATLTFDGSPGVYNVTITALGEVDGDGEFRFLVDGAVVGSAVNAPADKDYGEQQHTFENISIPTGALLGVESIAVSNDTVPEGDGYAFARGRWTTLTLEAVAINIDPPGLIEPVDLNVTLNTTSSAVTLGDEVVYTIVVENFSEHFVATNPLVQVTLPTGLEKPASTACTETDTGTLSCALSEIATNGSTTFTVTATAATVGEKIVSVVISADQEDNVVNNNSSSITTLVENEAPAVDSTVDLQLTISADKEQLEVGDTLTYTLDVTNLHKTNIATSPGVGISLPDSLQFVASDICTDTTEIVQCDLQELPPSKSATVQFTATAIKVDSYSQLFATTTSAQTENIVANNEAQIVTVINTKTLQNIVPVTNQPAATVNSPETNSSAETNSTQETQTKSSGGGILHSSILILLLIRLYVTGIRSQFNRQKKS